MSKHVNTPEAAGELGVETRTLERWRLERRGPPYRKFGRRVLYELDALHDWAQKQTVQPGPQ